MLESSQKQEGEKKEKKRRGTEREKWSERNSSEETLLVSSPCSICEQKKTRQREEGMIDRSVRQQVDTEKLKRAGMKCGDCARRPSEDMREETSREDI